MRELNPKWIVEGGTLIIRKAVFHKDIAEKPEDVKGGGWFSFEPEMGGFVLYGRSEDFGNCSKELVADLVSRKNVGRFIGDQRYSGDKIYFSSSLTLEEAKEDCVLLSV